MERSMNPSSRRSRRWITKALLELMMAKPYQKISITEIAEEADVVRRTFYRNFESKEDVIKTYIESIFKGFIKSVKEDETINKQDVAKDFFEYMNKHRVFLKLLHEHEMFDLILEVFEERIFDNDENDWAAKKEESEVFIKYTRSFFIAGLWYMLETWLKSGMLETPDELASIFETMLQKDIKKGWS